MHENGPSPSGQHQAESSSPLPQSSIRGCENANHLFRGEGAKPMAHMRADRHDEAVEKRPQTECAKRFTHEWHNRAFHGTQAASINAAKSSVEDERLAPSLRPPPQRTTFVSQLLRVTTIIILACGRFFCKHLASNLKKLRHIFRSAINIPPIMVCSVMVFLS
jgi:hypothetical protein